MKAVKAKLGAALMLLVAAVSYVCYNNRRHAQPLEAVLLARLSTARKRTVRELDRALERVINCPGAYARPSTALAHDADF